MLEGRRFFGHSTIAGARLEQRQIEDQAVRNPRGPIEAFNGTRLLASAFVERSGLGLGTGRAELFGASDVPGLSLGYSLPWNPGETTARLDMHRPYWDFVEGIVHGGYRDRVELFHRLRLGPPWSAEFAMHINRYGLADADNVANSKGLRLSVQYVLSDSEPALSLGYGLDTERYGRVETRRGPNQEIFSPIDFSDREVQSLQLVWSDRLTDYLWITAVGGYTYDRLNDAGTQISVDLGYEPLPNLEFGLRFQQSVTSSRGGSGVFTSLGGFVIVRP